MSYYQNKSSSLKSSVNSAYDYPTSDRNKHKSYGLSNKINGLSSYNKSKNTKHNDTLLETKNKNNLKNSVVGSSSKKNSGRNYEEKRKKQLLNEKSKKSVQKEESKYKNKNMDDSFKNDYEKKLTKHNKKYKEEEIEREKIKEKEKEVERKRKKEEEKIKEEKKREKEEKERKRKKKEKEEQEKKEREEKERREKEEKKLKEEREKKENEEKERREKEEKEKREKEEKERKKKEEKERREKEEKEKKLREKNKEKEEETDLTTTSLKSSNIFSSSQSNNSNVFKIITNKLGFRNLGNTCFMNTCLQNLVHSEYFIKELFSRSHLISSKTSISQKFYELCNDLVSCSKYAYSPDDFKSEFGCSHSMFGGYRQHDTQEFCRILLEDMNKELNEVKNPAKYEELKTEGKSKVQCDREYDEFFRKRENSLIMDVFYGQLINIFKCDCGKESYSFEKILDLPLLLKRSCSHTIKELMDDYFEQEEIIFETKCESCGKKGKKHTKKVKFSQPPNILILSLQRIDGRSQRKIDSQVSFTDELDLSKYIDKDCYKDSAKYTLYGIGNHSGSINFGHYYAYIRINDGKWYEFNDSNVSEYTNGSRSSSSAYVLFYKKNYYSK